MCALHIKAGLSLRNWFIGFPDILVVVVMLYLWGNCWSLSLCSPNLFYILLWPLVLSRPLQQLLLKKRKRQVHIDQDLHVYCQDCDLFYCVFVFRLNCFSSVSLIKDKGKTRKCLQSTYVFYSMRQVTLPFHVVNVECEPILMVYFISVNPQQITTAMLQLLNWLFFSHIVWKATLLNSRSFFPFFKKNDTPIPCSGWSPSSYVALDMIK